MGTERLRSFRVDQRPVRDRCAELLARPDLTRAELEQPLRGVTLVPGTTPEGVARLLVMARRTGSPETCQRSIDRAIPLRGSLRPLPAIGALAATLAVAVGLAWLSPWALVAVVVLLAWLGVRALRRFVDRRAVPVIEVARMEKAALEADRTGDRAAVKVLYEEARRMITEDRVPAGVGFRVANVLCAAASTTPFPVDLLRELRQLLLIAPEAELSYSHVRDEIERRFQSRVDVLAARIRRALRAGEPTTPLRAELRELVRTAPAVAGARARQAEILRHIASTTMDADPATPLDHVFEEIDEVIARLEAIDGEIPLLDSSPRELAAALEEIVARSTAWAARDRAHALHDRLELISDRAGRRRKSQPIAELRVAVAAIDAPGESRHRVIAHYRQMRDAAARGQERRQRDLITAMRLVSTWAANHGDAALLGEIRGDAQQLLARRSIPAGTGAELADVLRAGVSAASFPTTLLDDYAALLTMAPDLAPPQFWSIVDASIQRAEVRIDAIAQAAGAGSVDALREIVSAFEATATLSRDPGIVERARRLAARTRGTAVRR